ncbi:MAG TPA: hypothetical protein VHG93_06750 [Longimicrobium sp.]|nr:hypothetical protein [Longimicrobium sp.]
MKKSTAIRLTLVSSMALTAAACGEERPTQTMRGYCDPANPDVCEQQPRTGYVPMYYPILWGGYYYDNRGVARTRPGGPVAHGAPAARVSRGGFGTIGSGRSGRS